jgi:hypothetical protein
MRENLLKEKHNGGLVEHFGHEKMFSKLNGSYYWPGMRTDVKKIGPCKVIRKFGATAYEIELPDEIGISPILNVVDLYPYRAEELGVEDEQEKIQWTKQIPVAEKPQMESIIDKRINRKTRRKEYFEYLVKLKGHPIEDASWENEEEIQRHGQTVQDFMNRSS